MIDRPPSEGPCQTGPSREGEGGSPTPQGPGGSRLPASVSLRPRHHPPPANAERVSAFGLARQWEAPDATTVLGRAQNVPIWRARRLSSADVLCACSVRGGQARRQL
jgi:hypothetical protein